VSALESPLRVASPARPRYGYLTWEWWAGIRGWSHPALCDALFWALRALRCDSPAALAAAPRLAHAALASLADVGAHELGLRLGGPAAGRWAALLHATAWLPCYAGGRALSSAAEAPLVTLALLRWPRRGRDAAAPALRLAALACLLRPTAVLLLAPYAALSLHALPFPAAARLLPRAALAAAAALAAGAALDTACSRALLGTASPRLVLSPLAFLHFNLLSGGAAAFGTHPGHWYLSQGLPAVLGTQAPLLLMGCFRAAVAGGDASALAASLAAALGALSLCGHKEHRFLLPFMPGCAALSGCAAARIARRRPAAAALLAIMLLPQLLTSAYLMRWHQAGGEAAMAHLAAAAGGGEVGQGGILALTPCHDTPGYSHLHSPVPFVILDCSPDWRRALGGGGGRGQNERDAFFAAPAAHLRARLAALRAGGDGGWAGSEAWGARVGRAAAPRGLPSHVLFFDDLRESLGDVLAAEGYAQTRSFFHAHFAVDRPQYSLLLWERGEPEEEAQLDSEFSEAVIQ